MDSQQAKYIPALRLRWLTPWYDPLLRWIMREETFKRRLIEQAHVEPGQRVLDLGCGTGTLTVMLKTLHPAAEVIGVDGDTKVLDRAKAKRNKQASTSSGIVAWLLSCPIPISPLTAY